MFASQTIITAHGCSLRYHFFLWFFICPQTENFSCHLVYRYFPYFDIPYGRIGVAELILRVMAHDNVQCTAFLFHILYEFYFATTHGTFRAHAIAAGYLFMLINEFMAEAERDTHVVIALQHFYFPAFGTGMEVKDIVLIAEVHGNYVWIAF